MKSRKKNDTQREKKHMLKNEEYRKNEVYRSIES